MVEKSLKRRIKRLEIITAQPGNMPSVLLIEFVQPGKASPELVGLMLRPLNGGNVVQIDRQPGESETAFRARFEAECAL